LQRRKKQPVSIDLVKISASSFMVEIYLILIFPEGLENVFTLLQKWGYLIAMCLVQGVTSNDSAESAALQPPAKFCINLDFKPLDLSIL
jgi:hypothetical protein